MEKGQGCFVRRYSGMSILKMDLSQPVMKAAKGLVCLLVLIGASGLSPVLAEVSDKNGEDSKIQQEILVPEQSSSSLAPESKAEKLKSEQTGSAVTEGETTPAGATVVRQNILMKQNWFVLWTLSTLGLILATLLILWRERKKMDETRRDVHEVYKEKLNKLEQHLVKYLETSIIPRFDEHSLRELLLPLLEKFKESEDDHEIVILGADRLRPSRTEYNRLLEKSSTDGVLDAEERTLFQYGAIFDQILMRASGKILRRYLSLFRPQDLRGRTRDFQLDYLKWLEDQIIYFRDNENYVIIDTPRAITWGAPKSIIFFKSSFAEVFCRSGEDNGASKGKDKSSQGGGILITKRSEEEGSSSLTDSIVDSTRKRLMDDYVDDRVNGPDFMKYSLLNMIEFEDYVDSIRVEVEQGGGTNIQSSIVFSKSKSAMRSMLYPHLRSFMRSGENELFLMGADMLEPSEDRLLSLSELRDDGKLLEESQTELEYGEVFKEILSEGSEKQVVRYISLFTPEGLSERTEDFRRDYVSWLKNQLETLKAHKNYQIVSTPRATVWGAPKSMIFVRNNMAEVFKGGGGLVVSSQVDKNDTIVPDTKKQLIDQYVDVSVENGGADRKEYGHSNVESFEKYLLQMEQVL